METIIELPSAQRLLIEEQRAKLSRVLSHAEVGEAIEIIRYGGNTARIISSATYSGGNRNFYTSLITQFFDDACQALKEGQKLRIQVVRSR